MLYGVIMSNSKKEILEKKIKNVDALLLVTSNEVARNNIYADLIKKYGEDLNLYVIEDAKDKITNIKNANIFCKNHLGYNDKYEILIL